MARRHKRRRSRKSPFKAIGNLFKAGGSLLIRALPTLIVAGAAVACVFGVRKALYADPNLNVGRVVVEPAGSLIQEEQVRLQNQLVGKNILAVDLESIGRELERRPAVRKAHVIRQFPDVITVKVEARQPAALIRFVPNGELGVISRDGMVLDTVSASSGSIVTIEAFGLGVSRPVPGKRLRNSGYTEAIRFMDAFWEHPLAKQLTIVKMSLDKMGNITVNFAGLPDMRFGRWPAERFLALEKAVRLIGDMEFSKIDYIDLQFDDVIVKKKR